MGILVLIGGGIAAALGAVALWWRGQIRKQADALESLARDIRRLRAMAGVVPRMEPAGASTPVPDGLAAITRELEGAGFRRLGDVVEHLREGGVAGVLRWFTSTDGSIFGWTGITPIGPAVLLLISEDTGGGFVTTLRAPDAPGVAVPPDVQQHRVLWEEGLGTTVEQHRRALTRLSAPVRVADLPAALASFDRLYARVGAWRAAQDPEQLLEADVRRIVGDRFDELGPTLVTLVQALDEVGSAMDQIKRTSA